MKLRLSVRFWLTVLFVSVTLIAMLAVYFTQTPSIEKSIKAIPTAQLEKDRAHFAETISYDLAQISKQQSKNSLKSHTRDFARTFKQDAWIYDTKGKLIYSQQAYTQSDYLHTKALKKGLNQAEFVDIDLDKGIGITSQPVINNNKWVGIVIVGSNETEAAALFATTKDQLRNALLVALVVSLILGLFFSEIITRQLRILTKGTLAIAQGDFDHRLKALVPDDIGRLINSFNLMAEKLGTAFKSLKSQRQEIATVINNMEEGIIRVDPDGIVKLVNPAVAELFGCRISQLKNRHIAKAINSKEVIRSVRKILEGETVTRTFNYNRRIISLLASPISKDNQVEGALLVFHDVTRQKKLEQAQAEFVANASHELNTPITSLKAYADLLDKKTTGKANKFVKTMEAEIDRLQRLVKELLTLARLDAGKIHLALKPHSIYEIVSEVVGITSPLADASDIALKVELEKSVPPVICDRDRLTEVLIGLTDNALKHTSSGDTVTLFAHVLDNSLEIGVKDTGPGIPEKVLPNIFQRFYHYQRGQAEDSEEKSTGLGLSIAREIMEAHGCTLKVQSKFGKGAKFFFRLNLTESK